MPTKEQDRLRAVHSSAIASLREDVRVLRAAQESDDCEAIDEARELIEGGALSVVVRSDWVPVGSAQIGKALEFCILTSTGGPATRIVGSLNDWGEPENARLQVQDWFTPWTDHHHTDEESLDVLVYAQQFYFGE